MASKRFEIDMALNASDVAKGAKDGEKALKDLDDAVGDVADASDKAGSQVNAFADKLVDASRKAGKSDDDIKDALRGMGLSARQAERAVEGIGDEFKETGREGDRALDKLEDSLKDVQQQSKRTEDAMDDIGDTTKRAFGRAEDGAKDFKQEAEQSAKETAASWDGTLEGIGDLAQEVAANAFSGFGPAGVAGGIAAAAGIAVIIDTFNKITEAADEARESAFSMAYDVGGALDAAGYTARLAEWTSSTEKLKEVRDLAVATGWDEVEVTDALASGGDKLDKLTAAFGDGEEAIYLTGQRIYELEAALKGTSEGYLTGAEAADINALALAQYADQVGVATGKTDELGNAIYVLPGEKEVVVNAATGKAYENVNQFDQKVGALPDSHNTDITATTGNALSAAQYAIDRINNMSATITVKADAYAAIRAVQNINWDN